MRRAWSGEEHELMAADGDWPSSRAAPPPAPPHARVRRSTDTCATEGGGTPTPHTHGAPRPIHSDHYSRAAVGRAGAGQWSTWRGHVKGVVQRGPREKGRAAKGGGARARARQTPMPPRLGGGWYRQGAPPTAAMLPARGGGHLCPADGCRRAAAPCRHVCPPGGGAADLVCGRAEIPTHLHGLSI